MYTVNRVTGDMAFAPRFVCRARASFTSCFVFLLQ